MKSFDDFRRRYIGLMVGIHVCGFKSELMDGTVKRGSRILESDEDMSRVLKDMYDFLADKPEAKNGSDAAKREVAGSVQGPRKV